MDSTIEITLPEFDLSGATETELGEATTINGSNDQENDVAAMLSAEIPDPNGEEIVLTITDSPNFEVDQNEYIIITIRTDAGIITPEIPKGFDKEEDGYMIGITFSGSVVKEGGNPVDQNVVIVKNPVSSVVPSAAVRVDLATFAEAQIDGSQEITVDFSGTSADSEFYLPTTMTSTRVTIRYIPSGKTATTSFSPSDILIQGARAILTVPDDKLIERGDYSISFSQQARIKNPISAGVRTIKVSSFVPGDKAHEIRAVIRRTTTVSPLEGPRDSQFTLEGKGYASGTVTVYHDADDNKTISTGEILASVKTSRGGFKVKLTAGGESGHPEFRVETRDSYGAKHFAVFSITSTMSFEPTTVGHGSSLKITLSDWQDESEEEQLEVAVVRIGGRLAYVAELRNMGVASYMRACTVPTKTVLCLLK